MKKLIVAVFLIVPSIGISQCKGDCENGNGTFKFDSGHKYVGEWVDNKFEGQGTMTYPNGNKYVGEWIGGDKNGYGVLTLVLSKKQKKIPNTFYLIGYKGNWKDDKQHGEGTAFYSNGTEWTGEWIEGEQGKVISKNNDNTYNPDDIDGDNNYTVITLEELYPNHFYLQLNFGGLKKDFVFDTGSTEIIFDQNFLKKLRNNGCEVKKTKIKGQSALTASGEEIFYKVFLLNNVKIGDYVLNNVVVSVGPPGTSSLCGIGLLKKFSNAEWNMKDSTLKLYK